MKIILLSLATIAAILCLQSCQEAEQSVHETGIEVVNGAETPAPALTRPQAAAFPAWFDAAYQRQQIGKLYRTGTWMHPNFLTGDFDDDNLEDIAFLAENITTGEKGLILLHQNPQLAYTVFGAGTAFEEMSNMDWIGIFKKVNKGETVAPTLFDEESGDILGSDTLNAVVLQTDAIFIHLEEECGGGVIYKKDKSYSWINIE